jgi:hypothetical protein
MVGGPDFGAIPIVDVAPLITALARLIEGRDRGRAISRTRVGSST